MNDHTLVFLLKGTKTILAMKKIGFGKGKWNGYGGKVEKGETIKEAAVRELFEESKIQTSEEKLLPLGVIEFKFLQKPEYDQDVHIFILEEFGEAIETEEMKPNWFNIEKLPLTEMWDGDEHWIPIVLNKLTVKAKVEFLGEGKFEKIEFSEPLKKIIKRQ
ncbi:MAG: 8-oxo-dGTP diphosphatase [archaeon]